MGVTVKSVEHHLQFLYSADLIEKTVEGNEVYIRLRDTDDPLALTLLGILYDGVRVGEVYRNGGSGRKADAATRSVLAKIAKHEGLAGGDWEVKTEKKTKPCAMSRGEKEALREV